MAPRFKRGHKVIITPVKTGQLSPRDVALEPYAGQAGKVVDYYWISLRQGTEVFYLYTVLMESDKKEIVVHEDELQPLLE